MLTSSITSFIPFLNHVSTRIKHTGKSTVIALQAQLLVLAECNTGLSSFSKRIWNFTLHASIPLHYVVYLLCLLLLPLTSADEHDLMWWSMPVTHYELCFVFVLSMSQLAQCKPTHLQSTKLWHFFEEKSIRFATPSKQLAHTPQGNQHMEVGEPDRKTGDFFSCFKEGGGGGVLGHASRIRVTSTTTGSKSLRRKRYSNPSNLRFGCLMSRFPLIWKIMLLCFKSAFLVEKLPWYAPKGLN